MRGHFIAAHGPRRTLTVPRLALSVAAFFLVAADWPQYLGPNRDCKSAETGLARAWPKDGPKIIWEKKAGSGWSGAAVAGDRAILFHRIGNDEVVECVDASSGKELWKTSYHTRYRDDFQFDDGPRSTPLIADGKVFTLGADGDLSCFDFAAGAQLWQKNVNNEFKVPKGFFGTATSPIIFGGKLLINVGAKGAGVVAFDPATGKEIWKAGDDGVSYSSPIAAKINGEDLAIFFTRQGLLALTEKGEARFEYPWRPRLNASVNAASPIVHGNQIFLSTSYGTGAILLEAVRGELKEIWKNDESLSCHYNTPVLVGDHLFGVDGRQEAGPRLRCVEWQSGKVLWSEEHFGCASLIAVDGMLLALTEDGDLVLFEQSPTQYKELARTSLLGKKARAAPALSNGKAYARDGAKWVCVDLKK
jgi:outer membrane protein assembly factor BamB